MITGFSVLVTLCDACGLTHGEMVSIRKRSEVVLHSDANRKGKATFTQVCAVLGLAVAFGSVKDALAIPSEKIIQRAKKPDIKAMCNG